MPALNFRKEFEKQVESLEKRQTIRAYRKDCRNPQPGQTLYLFTGLRTAYCKRIGEHICTEALPICITEQPGVVVGIDELTHKDCEQLARDDGFENFQDFIDFFKKVHGLPFYGILIKW